MDGSLGSGTSPSTSMTSLQALRLAKKTLRKQMATKLYSLSPASIAFQSSQIVPFIIGLPSFQKAESVSIYVNMNKGEVHTEELCRQTLALGKKLYVPRFASTKVDNNVATFETEMRMLRVFDWADFEAMLTNKWGIREPEDMLGAHKREDALEADTGGDGLDLILVPGVAFDRYKGRLGHGKGYYDRYIAKCGMFQKERSRSRPVTIALALKEQILAEPQRVPSDDLDQQLDGVVTFQGPL
ncbi:hypothetical protein CBS101457_001064 [Exobasidium rhododendri]|nr:hypothetical protein CBS101457_001064 [Exobasidium rhododendri]